jgi:hypothetical protein
MQGFSPLTFVAFVRAGGLDLFSSSKRGKAGPPRQQELADRV